MTPETEQPAESTVKPAVDKLTVLEKEMGRLNTLASAGFYEAICPEVLPELHRQVLSRDFLATKRVEVMLNRISILRRTASQCPELTTPALQAAASIEKLIELELANLPSTEQSPEQLATAANGSLKDLLEIATRLGAS